MTCDMESQWNLYPKLAFEGTACVERPTCKVSDLQTIETYNNLVPIDIKSTEINPGIDFSFKCKSIDYKQVTSSQLSARCMSDGTWGHAFQTKDGAKACMMETKCSKSDLTAQKTAHNLKFSMLVSGATYVHYYIQVGEQLAAKSQVKFSCKPDFTMSSGATTFYAVCGVDGKWTDTRGNAQTFATEASSKICSAAKSKCTVGGIVRAHEQSWRSDCNTCTCNDGSSSCSTEVCPKCTMSSVKNAVNNADFYGTTLADGELIFFFFFFFLSYSLILSSRHLAECL
jgi:hypothetical protein